MGIWRSCGTAAVRLQSETTGTNVHIPTKDKEKLSLRSEKTFLLAVKNPAVRIPVGPVPDAGNVKLETQNIQM